MLRIEVVGLEAGLKRIGDGLMALVDDLKAFVTSFDAATNAVAAEIKNLKDQIAVLLANPNAITDEDRNMIEQQFTDQIAKLQALGTDPPQALK
jgi:septal ring factor EnvC (AmiA/AmiB activator)